LPEVAQELQVDGIVEGSVLRSGDQVRITAQLIYAPRDQHLWAEEYQRYVRDVLYLQREVARDIAEQVRVTLTPNERSQLAYAGAVDPAAYESYLRGRSFWNQRSEDSLLKAIDQFNKAIELMRDMHLPTRVLMPLILGIATAAAELIPAIAHLAPGTERTPCATQSEDDW
jgi:hypothetical protein